MPTVRLTDEQFAHMSMRILKNLRGGGMTDATQADVVYLCEQLIKRVKPEEK